MSRPIAYPIEIVDAAQKITKAAAALNALMDQLRGSQAQLQASMKGSAAGAIAVVHDEFQKSGLNNNAKFIAVAAAADESHTRMTDFDRFMANRFQSDA